MYLSAASFRVNKLCGRGEAACVLFLPTSTGRNLAGVGSRHLIHGNPSHSHIRMQVPDSLSICPIPKHGIYHNMGRTRSRLVRLLRGIAGSRSCAQVYHRTPSYTLAVRSAFGCGARSCSSQIVCDTQSICELGLVRCKEWKLTTLVSTFDVKSGSRSTGEVRNDERRATGSAGEG